MKIGRLGLGVVVIGFLTSCWGSSQTRRNYFMLSGVVTTRTDVPPFVGLVRVRNMDAASVYEKFQVVVRRNPFELTYSEENVWAVKPSQMVSDVIAQALVDGRRFSSVVRQLGELRPDYILGGDLHAIEVYDSGDMWYAHLALSLHLSRFDNGATLLTYSFDERRPLAGKKFALAARAMSELLSTAIDGLLVRLAQTSGSLDLSNPPDIDSSSGPGALPSANDGSVESHSGEIENKSEVSEPNPDNLGQDTETIFVPSKALKK